MKPLLPTIARLLVLLALVLWVRARVVPPGGSVADMFIHLGGYK